MAKPHGWRADRARGRRQAAGRRCARRGAQARDRLRAARGLRAADAARLDGGGRSARSPEPRPARRHGIALLDRDVVSLEPVATELEQAGVEVRLANQPEEMALLLRVDASGIDAVVCDVMSFRPDQNVAGLLRAWDKDRPGLAFFLSYDAQSPVELERARRTPMSLTAGHIQRPLPARGSARRSRTCPPSGRASCPEAASGPSPRRRAAGTRAAAAASPSSSPRP